MKGEKKEMCLANPIPKQICVAEIFCEGKWGRFTTEVFAEEDETVMDAIFAKSEELENLGTEILEVIFK